MAKHTHKKIDVAGLKIDAITKGALLESLRERIAARKKTFVVTPYSEFLYESLHNPETQALLNSADFSIADGIGVLWAQYFLSIPLTVKNFYAAILQAWWQVVWTGASILLSPQSMYKVIPEKIVGADLIWDLAKLAEQNNFSVFIAGAEGDVPKRAADILKAKYPNLRILGASNKHTNDPAFIAEIKAAAPDMLFVALANGKQERWIHDHLPELPVYFAIGLGGTFDYLTGYKKQPPQFIRKIGLEWLYRLVTQPSRLFRIYNGVVGLIVSLVRYKVYAHMPYRLNVSTVVVNAAGKILLCKRATNPFDVDCHGSAAVADKWQFPSGGIEEGEDVIAAARRELREETGIKTVEIIRQAQYVNRYEWNNATRPMLKRFTYHKKGQEQFTVFFTFNGTDDELHFDQRELTGYEWVSAEDVVSMLAPYRQKHADTILEELAKLKKLA